MVCKKLYRSIYGTQRVYSKSEKRTEVRISGKISPQAKDMGIHIEFGHAQRHILLSKGKPRWNAKQNDYAQYTTNKGKNAKESEAALTTTDLGMKEPWNNKCEK